MPALLRDQLPTATKYSEIFSLLRRSLLPMKTYLTHLPYYRLNICVLKMISLWPYTNNIFRITYGTIIFLWYSSALFFEVASFVTVEYTPNLLIRNLAMVIISIGSFAKYAAFLLQPQIIKNILDNIELSWVLTRSEAELDILKKHGKIVKLHTKMFAIFIYPAAAAMLLSQYSNQFLDIVAPLNVSRQREHAIVMEFFVDNEKYYDFIALYIGVLIMLMATTFFATESFSIMSLLHAGSHFEIVRFRIDAAFSVRSLRSIVPMKDPKVIESLASVVDKHNECFKYCAFLKENFSGSYSVLLAAGVSALAICLYKVFVAIKFVNIEELLSATLLTLGICAYMFYINYIMQLIVDISSKICHDLFNVNWYNVSISSQKVLLIIMMRCCKVFTFDLYGLYNGSLEGFSLIIRMSFSYFMVLQSYK